MTTDNQERAAFEAWYEQQAEMSCGFLSKKRTESGYSIPLANSHYVTWQAARAQQPSEDVVERIQKLPAAYEARCSDKYTAQEVNGKLKSMADSCVSIIKQAALSALPQMPGEDVIIAMEQAYLDESLCSENGVTLDVLLYPTPKGIRCMKAAYRALLKHMRGE